MELNIPRACAACHLEGEGQLGIRNGAIGFVLLPRHAESQFASPFLIRAAAEVVKPDADVKEMLTGVMIHPRERGAHALLETPFRAAHLNVGRTPCEKAQAILDRTLVRAYESTNIPMLETVAKLEWESKMMATAVHIPRRLIASAHRAFYRSLRYSLANLYAEAQDLAQEYLCEVPDDSDVAGWNPAVGRQDVDREIQRVLHINRCLHYAVEARNKLISRLSVS